MENKYRSVFPLSKEAADQIDEGYGFLHSGLTKHEYACIKLGIPETGDKDLDDLIRKSERKRIAAMAMQGILANAYISEQQQSLNIEYAAVQFADDLIKQLEKSEL